MTSAHQTQTEIETILSQIADLARSHGLAPPQIQTRQSAVCLDTIRLDRTEFKTLVRIANEIVTTIQIKYPHRTVGRAVQGGETAWFWRSGRDVGGYRIGITVKQIEAEQTRILSGAAL